MTAAPVVVGAERNGSLGSGDDIEQQPRGSERSDAEFSCRQAPVALQFGCSESIDPDNVGDIADEGAGQRG